MVDPLALEIAELAVEASRAAGATEAEACCTIARRFSATARGDVVEKLEQATGRALRLRVFAGEPGGLRATTLGTTDLTPQTIRAFAKRAVEAARLVGPDPFAGLPAPSPVNGVADLRIDAQDVRETDSAAKLDDVRSLERAARAVDPRIENSNGSLVADAVMTIGFANSAGARAAYRSTSASRTASPVGRDGDDKRTATYGTAARSWRECEDSLTVGKTAARRLLSMFGARSVPTQKMPVIFERDVAAAVLSDVFSALFGANVATGNSYL
ncbi:MAG: hypothetical protein JO101_07915, partial [Candidatus Eremiobacteraeota bacterium]|nr:hypothetical protein [Candidatus Eremiobacteraeota bacterium]